MRARGMRVGLRARRRGGRAVNQLAVGNARIVGQHAQQASAPMTPLNVSIVILLLSPVLGLLLLVTSANPALHKVHVALKWLAIAALTFGLAGTLYCAVFGLGFV